MYVDNSLDGHCYRKSRCINWFEWQLNVMLGKDTNLFYLYELFRERVSKKTWSNTQQNIAIKG